MTTMQPTVKPSGIKPRYTAEEIPNGARVVCWEGRRRSNFNIYAQADSLRIAQRIAKEKNDGNLG
jgi:hypothetical protein